MKELLTLKEAASLAGRTTKTIKNYIKQGKITNFFLVEGKYGQEYRINVKDVEPLVKKQGVNSPGKKGESSGKHGHSQENSALHGGNEAEGDIYDRPEYQFLLRRNDEILMDIGRCQARVEKLESSNLELRQELEEKNMLITMLMEKKPPESGKG
jgi:hypothetical protein